MKRSQCILVPVEARNLPGDYEAIGPFESFDAAKKYAIDHQMVASHYAMPMHTPRWYR